MDFTIASEVQIGFLFIVLIAIFFFYKAHSQTKALTFLLLIWSIVIGIISYSGFFSDPDASPFRIFIALSLPTVLIILGLSPKGIKWMLQNRNTKWSTLLHIIRIPIELTLFYLFTKHMVPELMTFEGRNFDIIIGISALVIGGLHWFNKIPSTIMLVWNYFGLALVLFILVNGILSAPLPIQQFAFDQPNIGILYFPITLLPGLLVPLVIYTHVTDIIYWHKNNYISRS